MAILGTVIARRNLEHGGSVVECLTRDRRVCGFEPTARHCVVSLSKKLYPLLSTGSTQ